MVKKENWSKYSVGKLVNKYIKFINDFSKKSGQETLNLQQTIHSLSNYIEKNEPAGFLEKLNEKTNNNYSDIEEAISKLTSEIYMESFSHLGEFTEKVASDKAKKEDEESKTAMFA